MNPPPRGITPAFAVTKANPLRVLLAEDAPVLRKILATQLKKLGHTPVLACDGYEAIELLKKQTFDLVLMDLEMPGLDGHEATRVLRRDTPIEQQPAVVALTAHNVDAIRDELLKEGMDDALGKPVRLYALTKLLVRVPRFLRARRNPPDK